MRYKLIIIVLNLNKMEKSRNINKIEKETFEVNDSVLNEILNGKDQSKLSFLKKRNITQ